LGGLADDFTYLAPVEVGTPLYFARESIPRRVDYYWGGWIFWIWMAGK
jgi:hypothetical protein